MSYADYQEMIGRLGEKKYFSIYRDDHAGSSSDLAEASAEINAFLAKRYIVPVTAGNALILLKAWTLDLAEEKAYKRAGSSDIPEKVKAAAAVVRGNLKAVSAGSMILPADAAENTNSPGGSVLVVGNSIVFARDDMAGY